MQIAHPDALVINVAGEASWLMNMQEVSTAVQYRLPVKQFILNNERLGMVRQWQELLHGERYSSSWSEALPDFVKLAEAFGAKGILCTDPAKLDDAIIEMLEYPGPVLFDCVVEKHENCFPMIPSGKAHNEMILGEDADLRRDRRRRRGAGLRGGDEDERTRDQEGRRAGTAPTTCAARPTSGRNRTRWRCWSTTRPACSPASSGSSPGAATTSRA